MIHLPYCTQELIITITIYEKEITVQKNQEYFKEVSPTKQCVIVNFCKHLLNLYWIHPFFVNSGDFISLFSEIWQKRITYKGFTHYEGHGKTNSLCKLMSCWWNVTMTSFSKPSPVSFKHEDKVATILYTNWQNRINQTTEKCILSDVLHY